MISRKCSIIALLFLCGTVVAGFMSSTPKVMKTCGPSYNAREPFKITLSKEDGDVSEEDPDVLTISSVIAQPVVWSSLYYVVTTGSGLPAGPFGTLGALEGLSYLVILSTCIAAGARQLKNEPLTLTQRLSLITLVGMFFAFGSLTFTKGCIPNAKPILDYSNIVRVC